MNRFQSIVDNVTARTIQELRESVGTSKALNKGYWYARDGKLWVQIDGDTFEFTFEDKDAESEAICLLINNARYMMQSFTETAK